MVKKIAKYTTDILGVISMFLIGLNQIEGIEIPKCVIIIQVIAVIKGVIETYLIGQKVAKQYG